MLVIGWLFFKKTASPADFFIGGRRLGCWVAALSTYASDMSGWLVMGLVGAFYAYGTGRIWMAVGFALGSVLNWLLVARRLRRYSLTAKDSITIPEYLESRFRDSSHTLRIISAFFILFFFTLYTASGFVACGTFFSFIFGMDYHLALLAGVLVIVIYTSLGGFQAVCWTDLVQGILLLITVIGVPIIAVALLGGVTKVVSELPSPFLPAIPQDKPGSLAVSIISGLTYGLGYFGLPHILIRFMAAKNERAINRAALIAGAATVLTMGAVVIIGIIGAAMFPVAPDPEKVFILMIQKMFTGAGALLPIPLLGGIFFCGICSAVMSTADSQLIMTASVLLNDIHGTLVQNKGELKHVLRLSRLSVVAVSFLAYVIASDQSSALSFLASNAWSGFGSCFGALILLSLYWRRLTRSGAVAGILAGGLTVIIWDYIPLVRAAGGWMNPGEATGIYSLGPGFCMSLFCIYVTSMATRPPSGEIQREFELAAAPPLFEE
jgi:sodium/proline symporter